VEPGADAAQSVPADAASIVLDASMPPAGDAAAVPGEDAGGLLPGADAGASALGHPFGTHATPAPAGVIVPSGSSADHDAATASFYDAWKARYLKAGCKSDERRVKSSPSTSAYTVSEAHGYGMVFAALMAGHDPDAQAIFDGLVTYRDRHPSGIDSGLMAWAQDSTCKDVEGNDAATDGDMDVAYALLLADRQWGSAGVVDYLAKAKTMIASILASEVHPQNSILVGDWAGAGDSHHDGTRPSDFMTGHFKAFQKATGTARWGAVCDKTYSVIAYLQDQYAVSTGLLPDFAIGAPTDTPQPAPAQWLEGDDDGHYSWNACRTPWRIATDFVVSGEPRSQAAMRKLNAWIRQKTGGDPRKIRDGYDLSGNALGTGEELAFIAPFGVAAMVEAENGSNQAWLDALWTDVEGRAPADYYGDSIKLMAMLVMSGNWWSP
jgi:endo-1,4-beta-D-glucanase Y